MSSTIIRPALTMSKLLESMDRVTAIRFLESIKLESRPESVWLKAWDEEAKRHERDGSTNAGNQQRSKTAEKLP